MESKELRLGNLVYYGESIRLITMIQDNPSRKAVGVDNMITYIEVLKPIPLSGELLVKCGFKLGTGSESEQYCLKIDSYLEIRIYHDDFSWEFADARESITPNCKWFKYLHQLQNLYFALTNQELQINLSNQ